MWLMCVLGTFSTIKRQKLFQNTPYLYKIVTLVGRPWQRGWGCFYFKSHAPRRFGFEFWTLDHGGSTLVSAHV